MKKFLTIIACLLATGALASPVQYDITIEDEGAGTSVHLRLADDGTPANVEVSKTTEYASECTTAGDSAEVASGEFKTGLVATVAISVKGDGRKALRAHLRDTQAEKHRTLPTECGDVLIPQLRTTEAAQTVAISDDRTNTVQMGKYRVVVKRVESDG